MIESRRRPLLRLIEGTVDGTRGSNSAPRCESTPGEHHLPALHLRLVRVDSDKATKRHGPSSPNRYPGGDAA